MVFWGLLLLVLVITVIALTAALSERPAGTAVPSRPEKMLGQRGRVTEDIDPVSGAGRVVVGGDDWAARSDKPLTKGTEVVVNGADGIVLDVAPWRGPGTSSA